MNTRKEVRKGRARNRTLLFQAGRGNDKKHSKKERMLHKTREIARSRIEVNEKE